MLVVVDAQEHLISKVGSPKPLVSRLSALVASAVALDVPVLFTEHCKEDAGDVLPDLLGLVEQPRVVPKTAFKATAELAFSAHLANLGLRQVVLAGLEAHICVLQTALGLLDLGYEVYLASDAIATRSIHDKATAMKRMTAAGVREVTSEMVLFEWLETSENRRLPMVLPEIRKLAAL